MFDEEGNFARWEMDAWGNSLSDRTDTNDFLPITSEGPKEHITGKMFDHDTGMYYFHARWYNPRVGQFVSRDPLAPPALSAETGVPLASCTGTGQGSISSARRPCGSAVSRIQWGRGPLLQGYQDQIVLPMSDYALSRGNPVLLCDPE